MFGKTTSFDEENLLYIVSLLAHKEWTVRNSATKLLEKIQPYEKHILIQIVHILDLSSGYSSSIRLSAAQALRRIRPSDKSIQLNWTEFLSDLDFAVRIEVEQGLREAKPEDPEVLQKIKNYNFELYQRIISQ